MGKPPADDDNATWQQALSAVHAMISGRKRKLTNEEEAGHTRAGYRRARGVVTPRFAYLAAAIANSAPLSMLSGQRCVTLL